MKFARNDVRKIESEERPVDMNDPESASNAICLSLPETFSEEAKEAWEYFGETAFLYEYKGRLVVTDESLYLTEYGDGTLEAPLGFPRVECDSWEELEKYLKTVYCELKKETMI